MDSRIDLWTPQGVWSPRRQSMNGVKREDKSLAEREIYMRKERPAIMKMFLQKDDSGGHNLVKTGNMESLQKLGKYAEKLDDKI